MRSKNVTLHKTSWRTEVSRDMSGSVQKAWLRSHDWHILGQVSRYHVAVNQMFNPPLPYTKVMKQGLNVVRLMQGR